MTQLNLSNSHPGITATVTHNTAFHYAEVITMNDSVGNINLLVDVLLSAGVHRFYFCLPFVDDTTVSQIISSLGNQVHFVVFTVSQEAKGLLHLMGNNSFVFTHFDSIPRAIQEAHQQLESQLQDQEPVHDEFVHHSELQHTEEFLKGGTFKSSTDTTLPS